MKGERGKKTRQGEEKMRRREENGEGVEGISEENREGR